MLNLDLREVLPVVSQLLLRPYGGVPVTDEPSLEAIDAPTNNPQVGITPGAKLWQSSQVLVTDVEAADVANLTVDDDDLPVVTVVQPEVKEVVMGQQKLGSVPTTLP